MAAQRLLLPNSGRASLGDDFQMMQWTFFLTFLFNVGRAAAPEYHNLLLSLYILTYPRRYYVLITFYYGMARMGKYVLILKDDLSGYAWLSVNAHATAPHAANLFARQQRTFLAPQF